MKWEWKVMKKILAALTGIILVTTILAGCSLSTDKVNITKEESGESIKQVMIDINRADLILKESTNSNIQAHLSGLMGNADDAVLTTSVNVSVLEIKAAYMDYSILDLNKETLMDQTGVKLTLSLPKKQYDKIQVILQDPDSKLEILDKEKIKRHIGGEATKVDSLFGIIDIKR